MPAHLLGRASPLLAVALLALAGLPASGQAGSEVTLDASPQLFTVLCAARVAGLKSPPPRAGSRVLVSQVDAALAQVDPGALAPLRAYFQETHPGGDSTALSAYVSVALLMEPPPDFKLLFPRDQLPPDVWPLHELPPVLHTFYLQADLERLWNEVRPAYERAIAEKQSEVAHMLLETRGYLRLTGESYPGRSYTIYLEWLVPPTLTSARNYGENYFLVIHPQRADFLAAVRHQYLHFLLDPLAAKYAEAMKPWAPLLPLAARAPRLPAAFRQDLLLLATESLVQAVELRLRHLTPVAAAAELDTDERSGYLFVRHFYQALAKFEPEEPSLRYYFPELLRGFDVGSERVRLESVEFAAATPGPSGPPAATGETPARLLAEADAYLAAGNYAAARERYERILREMNPDEPGALYGMAILASVEQDREQAKRYFLRTLEQAHDTRILAWTHVYLGRIYDMEGERQQALAHYQAALALNTRLDKAEQAARRGLERPFGAKEETDPRPPRF